MISPTTVLVFLATLLLTFYVIKMPRMLHMPPGPWPLPILGNFLEVGRAPSGNDIHVFQAMARKYGKLFSLKIGQTYCVVINDYNLLIEAFVKKADAFSNRPKETFHVMKYLNAKLGTGVITNDGHSWKQLRRITLMTMRDFGVGKRSLEEKIHEEISFFLEGISENEGQPYHAKPMCSLATSNVICGIIFGSRFDYEDAKFKELLEVLKQSLSINPFFSPINFFPFLKLIPYFSKLTQSFGRTLMTTADFIQTLSDNNEATFDPENIRDFVDLFIQMKKENKDDGIHTERNMRRVIVELFTAGSDTTASVLSWSLLYMAQHPRVQAKCQEEIDFVLGKGKKMSMADKDKLPYVEATILEVLRVRPAAPFGVIHSTSKNTELGGYFIPKDTIVFSNIMTVNSDPEIFPEPDNFKPEHFLDKDGKITHRDRIVSFSVGPRSCLGEILAKMELTLFFTSIFQFYTVSPEPGKEIDFTPNLSVIMHHKPQNLIFTRRE